VSPEAYDTLRAAAGERIMQNITNAQGDISGVQLHNRLRQLDQQGVLNDLLPNGQILNQELLRSPSRTPRRPTRYPHTGSRRCAGRR